MHLYGLCVRYSQSSLNCMQILIRRLPLQKCGAEKFDFMLRRRSLNYARIHELEVMGLEDSKLYNWIYLDVQTLRVEDSVRLITAGAANPLPLRRSSAYCVTCTTERVSDW
jgi:hypothetical protein